MGSQPVNGPSLMCVASRPFTAGDLVGGHVALDLVNTVTGRDQPQPVDWLDGFARLIEWAGLAGIICSQEGEALALLAKRSSNAADTALARTRTLREAIHASGRGMILGTADTGLDQLEREWKIAAGRARLSRSDQGADVAADLDASGLGLIADRVALAAVALLQHFPFERTRICVGTHCGWLFIDSSKAGRRRWCDMATCGNAAKSRRHYATRRKAGQQRRAG